MSTSRVPRTGMESTRAILRRMLEVPRNPLIVREPHAPSRCVWCGEEIAPEQPAYEFAGRLLHDGGASAPECRREFDTFIGDEE